MTICPPPSRLPVGPSPALAVPAALWGGARPPAALPEAAPQRRPAGEAAWRPQRVLPGLRGSDHVEEGPACRHAAGQGLSAGPVPGQQRPPGPGQGAAAETGRPTGCTHTSLKIRHYYEIHSRPRARNHRWVVEMTFVQQVSASDCEIPGPPTRLRRGETSFYPVYGDRNQKGLFSNFTTNFYSLIFPVNIIRDNTTQINNDDTFCECDRLLWIFRRKYSLAH